MAVEAATCNEDIYPGELPWGSACTCRVAPVHFRLPIAGPVLSPHVHAPLPSHVGPQQQDQSACSQESCHPGGPLWGQHVPGVRPPSTFGRILRPGYKFSPRARAGPEAAVVDDEGAGLLANCAGRHAVILLPDHRHAARGHYVSAHFQFNVPGPPQGVMLRTQAVRMKSLQASERPADLAPVLFNC
jgi:hypothetical protein